MKFKLFCDSCKSECDIIHEMDSYQYSIDVCPFCGHDVDEDNMEELEEYGD